jgi:hypothetical protein
MRRKIPREEVPAPRRSRRPPEPTQSLRAAHDAYPWWWVNCTSPRCTHRAPMALAPLMIRWGMDESTDMLRRSARCMVCGQKGATLQHPSWQGNDAGFGQFPAEDYRPLYDLVELRAIVVRMTSSLHS